MHGRRRLSEPSSAAGTSVAEEAPSRQEKYNTNHVTYIPAQMTVDEDQS